MAFDLKGSQINRLVPKDSKVLLDSNFIKIMNGRPIMLQKRQYNLLRLAINQDTLLLSKNNIVDYSLLMVLNKQTLKVRFGIIDYL